MTPPIAWLTMAFGCVTNPKLEAFRYVASIKGISEAEFEAWAEGKVWT
jgi:hypothetical protein